MHVEVYFQSSLIAVLSKMSPVLSDFLVKWNGAYYTKNTFKILISNGMVRSLCIKGQEGRELHWVSGNKVLDPFSMIQYMTISCL